MLEELVNFRVKYFQVVAFTLAIAPLFSILPLSHRAFSDVSIIFLFILVS